MSYICAIRLILQIAYDTQTVTSIKRKQIQTIQFWYSFISNFYIQQTAFFKSRDLLFHINFNFDEIELFEILLLKEWSLWFFFEFTSSYFSSYNIIVCRNEQKHWYETKTEKCNHFDLY